MNLAPLAIQKFFDNNGNPMNGGLLFTYVVGTTTKIATYTDSSGGTPNTNPIVLDYRGEARVWLDPTLVYKFTLAPPGDTDPPSKPIWTVDNITSAISFADLTQQIIGQILWPRTAAEIAAGVTPTFYYFPPGSWLRYGADPTGAAASDTAISNAIKCNAHSFDDFPTGGQYRLDVGITIADFPRRISGTAPNPNLSASGTVLTLKTAAGASAAAFQTSANIPNISFEDLTIAHQTTTTAQRGVIFGNDSRYCRVTRCVFVGAGAVASTTKGIQFTGGGTYSAFNVIDQCYFSGHIIGIDLQGINTVTDIINCDFVGYTTSASSYALKCSNNSTYTIYGGHIEGFNTANSRGIYSEGAYQVQIGIRYEVNTVNWEWVRTAPNTRIYGMALFERFVSGGNPVYPASNDIDACMVLTGPGIGTFDTMGISAYRGYSERARSVSNGTYATNTYAGGDYTANGGATWTVDSGDVTTSRYAYVGSRGLHWELVLVTTAITVASPTQLIAKLPGGATAAAFQQTGLCVVSIAGVNEVCAWDISASSTLLAITRLGGGSYGTVAIGVKLNGVIEIA